jgi:hypothetical protein
MATESDNVNSGALGTLLSVGAFATLAIALVVTALVRAEMTEELEKKEVSADRPYRDLVAEQTAKLSAPAAYVDRGRGLVSLPIDRAMELTVANLKKDPNSATPPPPKDAAGGSGGTGGAGSSGGMGGSGGGMPTADVTPSDNAQAPKEDEKPAEGAEHEKPEKKPEGEKKPEKKKEEPKPAPTPAATPPAPHAQ